MADELQAVGVDTGLDQQRDHRVRATQGQVGVVDLGTDGVGVARDLDLVGLCDRGGLFGTNVLLDRLWKRVALPVLLLIGPACGAVVGLAGALTSVVVSCSLMVGTTWFPYTFLRVLQKPVWPLAVPMIPATPLFALLAILAPSSAPAAWHRLLAWLLHPA